MGFRRILEFKLLSNGHKFQKKNDYISHILWMLLNLYFYDKETNDFFWFWLNICWIVLECFFTYQYRKWYDYEYQNQNIWKGRCICAGVTLVTALHTRNSDYIRVVYAAFGGVGFPFILLFIINSG